MADMHSPIGSGPRTGGSRSGSHGLVLDSDRTREFRRATRHTLMVKILRGVLPLVTLGIMGSYVATGYSNMDLLGDLKGLPIPKITSENLTMDNPRYEGFTEAGGSYRVTALKARQDFAKPDLIQLEGISGDMLDAARRQTRFKASRGVFNSKRNELALSEGIEVTTSEGSRALLKSALVRIKAGIITTREPVRVTAASAQIDARRMLLNRKTKEVQFAGDVVTLLTPAQQPKPGEVGGQVTAAGAAAEASLDAGGNPDVRPGPAVNEPRGLGLMGGASTSPVRIESAALDVNDGTAVAVFSGGVKATQDGQSLQTKTLRVVYARADDKAGAATAAGGAAAAPAASPFGGQGTQVKEILADEPVLITRDTGEQVTSDKARFDVAGGKAELIGTVIMTSTAGRRIAADRADLDEGQNTALLVGNVVVNDIGNELRGARLFVDRAKGITNLSTPGAKGRIVARLNQPQPQAEAAAAAATAAVTRAASSGAAKPAPAPAPAGPPAGTAVNIAAFKADPKAPIDIEADTLDVDDGQKAAVFKGAVDVVQGGFKLTTSQLTAHYTGGSGLAGSTATPGALAPTDQPASKLTRILARGKVVMGSVGGQHAIGEWADFDVAGNTATIGGEVVLSQGKNIVRGSRLKVDLATGKAVIETAPETVGAAWASTVQSKGAAPVEAALPTSPAGRGARPSAVFYPKELKPDGKPPAKDAAKAVGGLVGKATRPAAEPAAPPAAASSWEATTEPREPESEPDDTAPGSQ